MKRIPLTRGLCAVIDDDDFERISRFRWFAQGNAKGLYYACRHKRKDEGSGITSMHREIAVAPRGRGFVVDHINHNTLDNTRSNLRIVTLSRNMSNRRGAHKNSKSGIRGVHWNEDAARWVASIQVSGKKIWLGEFLSKDDAASCYAAANRRYFGEFGGNL